MLGKSSWVNRSTKSGPLQFLGRKHKADFPLRQMAKQIPTDTFSWALVSFDRCTDSSVVTDTQHLFELRCRLKYDSSNAQVCFQLSARCSSANATREAF
jgi:hypothetical protein